MKSFEDFGLKWVYTVVFMRTWRFVSTRGQGHYLTFDLELLHVVKINIGSKATGPVETQFHAEPLGVEETEICSNLPGHMTSMAATP